MLVKERSVKKKFSLLSDNFFVIPFDSRYVIMPFGSRLTMCVIVPFGSRLAMCVVMPLKQAHS